MDDSASQDMGRLALRRSIGVDIKARWPQRGDTGGTEVWSDLPFWRRWPKSSRFSADKPDATSASDQPQPPWSSALGPAPGCVAAKEKKISPSILAAVASLTAKSRDFSPSALTRPEDGTKRTAGSRPAQQQQQATTSWQHRYLPTPDQHPASFCLWSASADPQPHGRQRSHFVPDGSRDRRCGAAPYCFCHLQVPRGAFLIAAASRSNPLLSNPIIRALRPFFSWDCFPFGLALFYPRASSN